MAVLLSDGLTDLSRELGESQTNQTSPRIKSYNDAVVEFANEKKWLFLIKKNETLLTIASTTTYNIPAAILADWRSPGAIKAIYIGASEFKPIDWEDRNSDEYDEENVFYIDPEETQITFKKDLGNAGQTITIHYYYIPARTEDLTTGSFPIPDRYRKPIAVLAAAFVQWSRYLTAQGNRLYNYYTILVGKIRRNQNETHRFKTKKLQHYLQYRGYKRTYPNQ